MSNNLNIEQMAPAQAQKETTHNDANGQIDAAITEIIAIAVDNTNAYTLTNEELREQFRFALVDDSPAPTAAVTITVPAIKRGLFIVSNGLSFTATVEISGQAATSPTVAAGDVVLLESDGTNVRKMVSGTSGSLETFLGLTDTPGSYGSQTLKYVRVNAGETALEFFIPSVTHAGDGPGLFTGNGLKGIRCKAAEDGWEYFTRKIDWNVPYNPGAPSSSEFMGRWVAPRAFEIPASLTESQGHAGVAATAQTDFDLQLNGSSIGTIRFAAAGTVATFIKASASVVAAGDRIDIIAPGTADSTLADLTFTIVGEYV